MAGINTKSRNVKVDLKEEARIKMLDDALIEENTREAKNTRPGKLKKDLGDVNLPLSGAPKPKIQDQPQRHDPFLGPKKT